MDSEYRQEVAPKGPLAFPKIAYKRHIPKRGPSSSLVLLAAAAFVGYTLWRGQRKNYILTELERERLQTEYLMKPIIQAEEDRSFLRNRYKMLKVVRDRKLDVDLHFYHNPRYYDSSIPLW